MTSSGSPAARGDATIHEVLDRVAGDALGPRSAAVDPLAEALHYLRMDGMFYCRSELTAPWGVDLPPMRECLWFHVVTRGTCRLTTYSGETILATAGDVCLLYTSPSPRDQRGSRMPSSA